MTPIYSLLLPSDSHLAYTRPTLTVATSRGQVRSRTYLCSCHGGENGQVVGRGVLACVLVLKEDFELRLEVVHGGQLLLVGAKQTTNKIQIDKQENKTQEQKTVDLGDNGFIGGANWYECI